MKTNKLIALLLLVLINGTIVAQVPTDTLTMVKAWMNQREFTKAEQMMQRYQANHPQDLYANWIYAQVAYLSHHFSLSERLYDNTIQLFPKEKSVRVDYAMMLANTGSMKGAEEQLLICANDNVDDPEPWLYLAKVYYWEGNYAKSVDLLDNLITHLPDYQPAIELRNEVRIAKAPSLTLEVPYTSDDQPLKLVQPQLTFGINRSNALALDVNVVVPMALKDTANFHGGGVNVGNKFQFTNAKMSLYLNLGLFHFSTNSTWGMTGEIKLEKVLFKKMVLWGDLKRTPYLYTLGSLSNPLFENHLTVAATWNDPDRWNGQINYERSTFSIDNNYINSYCGWIFTPAVKAGKFDFHFGYGYNYSTSKQNNFVSTQSVGEILSNWDNDSIIKGAYDPYFTPKDQQVHSLLALIHFKAAKKLTLTLNLNGGVYATTKYPYLYLNTTSTDSIYIERAFTKESYHPINGALGMLWKVAPRFDLQADFTYNSTIYYKTLGFNLTLRKRF